MIIGQRTAINMGSSVEAWMLAHHIQFAQSAKEARDRGSLRAARELAEYARMYFDEYCDVMKWKEYAPR